MATTTETGLEHRVAELERHQAELEHVVAQLIRVTYSAAERLGRGAGFGRQSGNGWLIWQQLGATHQAVTELHGYLQRHPAAGQD